MLFFSAFFFLHRCTKTTANVIKIIFWSVYYYYYYYNYIIIQHFKYEYYQKYQAVVKTTFTVLY